MYLNSNTINAFTQRLYKMMKSIMVNEMGLQIYNRWLTWYSDQYWFSINIMESKSTLACFNSLDFSFDFSQTLLTLSNDESLKNIIRHELVHMICVLKYGPSTMPHGELFKATARSFNFNESVLKATMNIQKEFESSGSSDNDKIVDKIRKLMALASSSNLNEAQAATLKANELLEKYNIDKYKEDLFTDSTHTELLAFSKNILHYKRSNAKMSAIAGILRTFWVSAIFSSYARGVHLCVVGEKHNVLMAEYVGLFLDQELEILWDKTKSENPTLKGIQAKNSFFYGVEKGYTEKINQAQKKSKKSNPQIQMGLAIIEKRVEEYKQIAFPKLSQTTSSRQLDSTSTELGRIVGKNLIINKGIEGKNSSVLMLN